MSDRDRIAYFENIIRNGSCAKEDAEEDDEEDDEYECGNETISCDVCHMIFDDTLCLHIYDDNDDWVNISRAFLNAHPFGEYKKRYHALRILLWELAHRNIWMQYEGNQTSYKKFNKTCHNKVNELIDIIMKNEIVCSSLLWEMLRMMESYYAKEDNSIPQFDMIKLCDIFTNYDNHYNITICNVGG